MRSDGRRSTNLAGMIAALVVLALFGLTAPEFSETASAGADSWQLLLDVCLRQLAWPVPHPAGAILMCLPGLWFLLDRLGRRALSSTDCFLILIGLWVAAHAVAIGYARGNATSSFVSRYCEFLLLGFLAQGACLFLLWGQHRSRPGLRAAVFLLGLLWVGFAARGLWNESVGAHAGHNLGRRLIVNEQNLSAIRSFLVAGDPGPLTSEPVRQTLYSYPPTVIELLAQARFRALLPPETGAKEARPDQGRLGGLVALVLRFGPWLAAGGALWLLGLVLGQRHQTSIEPPPLAPSIWTPARLRWTAASATVLMLGALLAWPGPLTFAAHRRWAAAISPDLRSSDQTLDLRFQPTVGRPVGMSELPGAVATHPVAARPYFLGTLLDGHGYTGILRSNTMTIGHHYLVAPITGWPCWPGNAVRWRLVDPQTSAELWLPVLWDPAEPRDGIRLWTEKVDRYRGWQAELWLYDGNTDEHGWVGFIPPCATDDPDLGRRWVARIHAERAESTHQVLAGAITLSLLIWLVYALQSSLSRPPPLVTRAPGLLSHG